MFDLFKRKTSEPVLYSPIEGKCIDLTAVPDQVFAQKIMGDGIAFIPNKNEIYAPCDGTISVVANTKHAIGMVSNDGVEIFEYSGVAEPYFPLKEPPIIPVGRANLSANKSQ